MLLGIPGLPCKQSDYLASDMLERSCEVATWRKREMLEEPHLVQHLAGAPEIMEHRQATPALPTHRTQEHNK